MFLAGCAASPQAVKINTIRIPANLLTPLEVPECTSTPVTVGDLIIQIARLEAVIEKANDRFTQIMYIQDDSMDGRIDITPAKGD